jgi:hypothetical protein
MPFERVAVEFDSIVRTIGEEVATGDLVFHVAPPSVEYW